MARPTDLTLTVQQEICKALETGATLTAAALAGGVTYQTILNWRKKALQGDPRCLDFVEAVDAAEAAYKRSAEMVVYKGIVGGLQSTETRVVTKRRVAGTENEPDLAAWLEEMQMRAREMGQPFNEAMAREALVTVEEVTTTITRTSLPSPQVALEVLARRYPSVWGKSTKEESADKDLARLLAEMGVDLNELVIRLGTEIYNANQLALGDSRQSEGMGGGEATGE